MNCSQFLQRVVARNIYRSISKCQRLSADAAAASVLVDKLTIPPPSILDAPAAAASAKIEKLVAEISQLNLLEVSELAGLLKQRLNLPDAPTMQMQQAAPAAAVDDEEDAPPATVKSLFTVKLIKFDEKQKVALIKEIKALMEGMNLVQAKKFVESAPTVVKADLPKDEADKLKDALLKVGAEVEVD